jgi:hypothetical protein
MLLRLISRKKLNILGASIASYYFSQSEINAKVDSKVNEFYSPLEFFNSLTDELRQEFINNLLTRKWQWDETNLDNIFKMSVRLIYNAKKEDNSDNINLECDECKNYLENLVRIDVKRNNS